MAEFLIALSALSNIILGILVYRKKSRDKSAKLFFIFTISAALWIATNLMWKNFFTYRWLALTYSSGVLFAFMGLIWPYMLVKKTYPRFFLLYLVSITLFILTFVNNMIVIEFPGQFSGEQNQFQTGPIFFVYAFYMLWVLGWSTHCLWSGYKNEKGLRKKQIQYVLLGGVIFNAIVIISDFILPGIFNNFTFAFIDSPSSLILIGLTAYATLKFRLMDVEVLIEKGFIYTTVGLFTYGIFHITAWSLTRLLGNLHSLPALIASLLIAFVFAILLPHVKHLCVIIANKQFYANIYNAQDAFQKLANAVVTMVKLNQIAINIVNTIRTTLNVSRIAFITTQERTQVIKRKGFTKTHTKIFEKNAHLLQQLHSIFLAEEIEYYNDHKTYPPKTLHMIEIVLKDTSVEIIVPLYTNKKKLGFILLGAKKGERSYTKEDVTLLDTLAKQGTIAINNALLYQNLREKNKRLNQLVEVQKEFLDIASHQLRTPLSIIRGASSMALNKEEAVLSANEAIPMIHEASIRMNTVVNNLLLASQLDAEGFMLDERKLQTMPILPLIRKIIDSLLPKIQEHRVAITVDVEENFSICADQDFLEIALANLLENAVRFSSQKYGGTVSVTSRQQENSVRISIKDNGIGIPEKEKAKLFQKFYRARNAMQFVPEGTGLGLFIVKKIVEAHRNGKFGVESVEGKGSEFWVEFKKA